MEAAKKTKDFKGLSSLIIREELYRRCSPKLTAYLREKKLTETYDVVTSAQRYVDSHNSTITLL